ncbi:MAG: ATP-binding cassette domain-containing protein, partial [Bradyrhizobium sp.]
MLQIGNLNAWYGASHVLQDITIEVAKGEIVCLIGRNGAGKTT